MHLVKSIYTLYNITDFLPKCVEPSCCVTDGFAKDSVALLTLEEQSFEGVVSVDRLYCSYEIINSLQQEQCHFIFCMRYMID